MTLNGENAYAIVGKKVVRSERNVRLMLALT